MNKLNTSVIRKEILSADDDEETGYAELNSEYTDEAKNISPILPFFPQYFKKLILEHPQHKKAKS